ncbi:AI-2E family transporter [Rhodococcus aerolatus]
MSGGHGGGEQPDEVDAGRPHRSITASGGEADPEARAESVAQDLVAPGRPLGPLGERFDRRSPFLLGMAASGGVVVTLAAALAVTDARTPLTLIGLALFLAVGLDPVVRWLERRHLPRWLGVAVVSVVSLAAVSALLAAAIPPVASQAAQLVTDLPAQLATLQDTSNPVGRFVSRYDLEQQIVQNVNGSVVLGNLVSLVTLVLDAVTKLVLLAVLTIFFLAGLPRMRRGAYRLVPAPRRPRAILIGDRILGSVGRYVLGNVVISVIAAVVVYTWLALLGVPYPLLLAITTAVLDLVPVVGSTVAGVVVSLVALTVSVPVTLATVGFFLVYRVVEDYVLVPRIIGRAVDVPAVGTVVAVLLGGAVLGAVGALVAIPVAAAVQLLVRELLLPRLDAAGTPEPAAGPPGPTGRSAPA